MSTPPKSFTTIEESRIRAAVETGAEVSCPRCGGLMEPHDIPPIEDVAYVRHRLWLLCVGCRRGIVLDRPRGR